MSQGKACSHGCPLLPPPAVPDAHQVGVRWVPLDDLATRPARKPLLPTPSDRLLALLHAPAAETVGCEMIV